MPPRRNRRPPKVHVERAQLDVDVDAERSSPGLGDRGWVHLEEHRSDVDREEPVGRRRQADRECRGEKHQRGHGRSRQAASQGHADQ